MRAIYFQFFARISLPAHYHQTLYLFISRADIGRHASKDAIERPRDRSEGGGRAGRCYHARYDFIIRSCI